MSQRPVYRHTLTKQQDTFPFACSCGYSYKTRRDYDVHVSVAASVENAVVDAEAAALGKTFCGVRFSDDPCPKLAREYPATNTMVGGGHWCTRFEGHNPNYHRCGCGFTAPIDGGKT